MIILMHEFFFGLWHFLVVIVVVDDRNLGELWGIRLHACMEV